MNCYCGKSEKFELCCNLYISGKAWPTTAESLMRSRYCAFVTKNYDYLMETHDPTNRKNFDLESNRIWAESVQFTRLEVLKSKESGKKAKVEFKAYYLSKGQLLCHHENSLFVKKSDRWYFSE